MIDADRDSMRASGGQFARELQAAGIAANYHMLPDSFHAFLNRPNEPGFADGLGLIIDWARDIQSKHVEAQQPNLSGPRPLERSADTTLRHKVGTS